MTSSNDTLIFGGELFTATTDLSFNFSSEGQDDLLLFLKGTLSNFTHFWCLNSNCTDRVQGEHIGLPNTTTGNNLIAQSELRSGIVAIGHVPVPAPSGYLARPCSAL